MVHEYSSGPAPPYGLWFPPIHSYLHGETVLPSSASKNRHCQQITPADRCYSAVCAGTEANADIQSARRSLQNRRMWVLHGTYCSHFQQAAGADQNMGFPGKSKDIALTMSRRRNQHWAQGSSPSLGFYSPIPHIKKCLLKVRRDSGIPFCNMGQNLQLAEISVSPTQQIYS